MLPELVLRTARLELIAASLELIHAELEGPEALGALLGVAIPASWPPGEYDREALEFFTSVLVSGGPAALGWYNWYAITVAADGAREALVAGGGYLGPPSQGTVEIGYSVLPEARGRGVAKEMVKALTLRALATDSVHTVIAQTLESNAISQQVLRRCGFRASGPGAQPGVMRFQCSRSPA